MSIIKLKNVSKFYYSKGVVASGFSKINLSFDMGEFIAITGVSGSGKSTLLNVISGLDTYEDGEMYINGLETSHYSEKDFEDYRRKYIGNIFQNFNLVNSYTVYQNIELVLLLNGKKKKEIKKEILELIKKVGLYKFRNTKVSKLSGGQKQRVAIARALAKDTPIIIADEPTGSLDSKAANEIIKLLSEIAKDKLVIIVTHNFEQIEPYITRQIKMHDGRILEDKKLKKVNSDFDSDSASYKNITFLNKVRLSFRNTFNIIPKFLLLLIVYLFITVAIISEYSSFKEKEYLESKEGSNYLFSDINDKRIIIKKNDKTQFTKEDYNKISKINNVEYIAKNDILLDTYVSLTDDKSYWIGGSLNGIDMFDSTIERGRLPEKENEIIIMANKNDYYITGPETSFDNNYYLVDNSSGETLKSQKLKIVGIAYNESEFDYSTRIYLNEDIIDKYSYRINKAYSTTKILFLNKYRIVENYDIAFSIQPNSHVGKNGAYVTSDLNYGCPKENCIGQSFKAEVENIFYNETLDFKILKTYNAKNMKSLLGIDNYEENNGIIYVNPEDYNTLYNKTNFQSSVFVKDARKIKNTISDLKNLDISVLPMKDALMKNQDYLIIRLISVVVMIVLIIVLFFISYFVIRIILKSRNKYFSTIRMLGGTKNISKCLLIMELFIISNIAYFSFITFICLNSINVININFVEIILNYLTLKDYIILYSVIEIMSYLISQKFSKKLFKNSVITTIGEEV